MNVLSLGLKLHDEIKIVAQGEQSKSLLCELEEQFNNGFGEEVQALKQSVDSNNVASNSNVIKQKKEVYSFTENEDLKGVLASPGFAVGKIFHYKKPSITFDDNSKLSVEQEEQRLQKALKVVVGNINQDIIKAKQNNIHSKIEIFSAHLVIMNDKSILDKAYDYIKVNKSAEYAYSQAIKDNIKILMSTKDPLLIMRADDLQDLNLRMLSVLTNTNTDINIPQDVIIVSDNITPSDLNYFHKKVKGVLLSKGSATSHVSIMLRNMDIPALVSFGDKVLDIQEGSNVVLNTMLNSVLVNPNPNSLRAAEKRLNNIHKNKEDNLKNTHLPSNTQDNIHIKVKGNIGNIEQAKLSTENGANGIGLLRSEFLFSSGVLNENEQNKNYQDILNELNGESLTIRLLDIGGDKPVPGYNLPDEENPIVGMRGVRNYSLNYDLFISQIRAILRLKPLSKVKIMVPMVALYEEVIYVKNIIEQECKALGVAQDYHFGIMVEVPSVVFLLNSIIDTIDFVSIGTNDLSQYMLAMDRGNSDLTQHIDALHPSVLHVIHMSASAMNKANKDIGVCGAMASDAISVPLLLGLGVNELSVTRGAISDTKALVRKLNVAECKLVAQKALNLKTANEVRDLVLENFHDILMSI